MRNVSLDLEGSGNQQRSDRTLVRISLGNRRLNSKELVRELKKSSGVELSAPTVRRRLLENGLRGCKARKKTLLTEKQRKRRLDWALSHVKWPIEKWRKVLFSDESTFTVNNHAGNNFVRRKPEEEYRPYCISPTIKHPSQLWYGVAWLQMVLVGSKWCLG